MSRLNVPMDMDMPARDLLYFSDLVQRDVQEEKRKRNMQDAMRRVNRLSG